MKLFAFSLSFLFLFFGCSSTKKPDIQNSFHTIDNSNYVFGDKNSAIMALILNETENNQLNKQIIFYISKFPYEHHFNLCNSFEKNLESCNSTIKITKNEHLKAPYLLQSNIVFPKSYDQFGKKVSGFMHVTLINNFLQANSPQESIDNGIKNSLVMLSNF